MVLEFILDYFFLHTGPVDVFPSIQIHSAEDSDDHECHFNPSAIKQTKTIESKGTDFFHSNVPNGTRSRSQVYFDCHLRKVFLTRYFFSNGIVVIH